MTLTREEALAAAESIDSEQLEDTPISVVVTLRGSDYYPDVLRVARDVVYAVGFTSWSEYVRCFNRSPGCIQSRLREYAAGLEE